MTKDLKEAIKIAQQILPAALADYQALFPQEGFSFYEPKEFGLAQNKGYSAKTEVPVRYKGEKRGNLVVVAFAPGDGTGNESNYSLDNLEVSSFLQLEKDPEKVVPRKKKGIHTEFFFPFATYYLGDVFSHTAFLEELTLQEGNRHRLISLGAHLGNGSGSEFKRILRGERKPLKPRIFQTTGYTHADKRFGDPHAIFSPPEIVPEGAIQFVGFLGVEGKENPLHDLLVKKSIVPKEFQGPWK